MSVLYLELDSLSGWVGGWVGVGLLCVTHRGAEPQVQSSWCLDEHRGSVWAADFHFSSFTAACYHIKDGSLSIRRGNRSKGLSSQPITFKYGLLKTDLQTLQFRNRELCESIRGPSVSLKKTQQLRLLVYKQTAPQSHDGSVATSELMSSCSTEAPHPLTSPAWVQRLLFGCTHRAADHVWPAVTGLNLTSSSSTGPLKWVSCPDTSVFNSQWLVLDRRYVKCAGVMF